MKLYTMMELLNDAYKNKYAVPAINVSNMETVNGLFEAAENMKAPVIAQIAPIQLEKQNISYEYIVELIKLSAKNYNVKYAIHLDHGSQLKDLRSAVDAGFTSVMYDGSALNFEENINNTIKARKIAKGNITLEGELGKLVGEEGKQSSGGESINTDPDEAYEFVSKTNVDCLAVSIGNAHGYYKGEPNLNFEILNKINEKIKMPIVMHGASGLSEKDIAKSVERGIAKINFFTTIDGQFTKGIIDTLDKNPHTYMMEYIENARQNMMLETIKVIKMCKCENRI